MTAKYNFYYINYNICAIKYLYTLSLYIRMAFIYKNCISLIIRLNYHS